jgi:hypothetical protein
LTLCYESESCVNNTLLQIAPNHIEFRDNSSHVIYLMKPSNQSIMPETDIQNKSKLADASDFGLIGTWSINNQSKPFANITFNNFIKYAHSKSPYCCDVNIQKFVANIDHKTFEGYWNATIHLDSPMYYVHSPKYLLPIYSSSIGLCAFNIQDHGLYHNNINTTKGFLSGCTKMGVDVIDNNHLRLHSLQVGMMYLTRETERISANQSSPYDSGYKHGVSDAKMEKMNPTSHSLYIVQPGNNLPNHTQNFTWGYIAGYCSLQSCADKNSTLDPASFNAGLRYGFYDWNQHTTNKPGGYECPLARTASHSNFCNGYDAALVYENSDY